MPKKRPLPDCPAWEHRQTWTPAATGDIGGWQQNAIKTAYLGLADEAASMVGQNFSSKSDRHRFPAMWGPNYDWIPDQDHGSVAMIALQRMVLQYDGDQVHVLPAWPRDWDVEFKLHAPHRTTIEGVVKGGKLAEIELSPESRTGNVVLGAGWTNPNPKRTGAEDER